MAIDPFFFGSAKRQLYGTHQTPTGTTTKGTVVLCAPFGQEYMRSHRAFRQLSLLLSRSGFHVFRFDYFGTGDSAGSEMDFSLADALEDLQIAIEEAQEVSDCEQVSLVGLRLGASIASLYNSANGGIKSLAMWDPVLGGQQYLTEIMAEAPRLSSLEIAGQSVAGVNGFALPASLIAELEGLDLPSLNWPEIPTLVVDSGQSDARQLELVKLPDHIVKTHVPSHGNWNDLDDFGGVLLHSEIVRYIVDWL